MTFVVIPSMVCAAAFAAPAAKPATAPKPASKAAFAPPPEVIKPSPEARQEAELAAKQFVLPKTVRANLWAAEPLLRNPVAFAFDEQGRMYVAEAFRTHVAVLDNRGREKWPSAAFRQSVSKERIAGFADEMLNVELASRTVADRELMMRTYFVGDMDRFTKESDIIKQVVDTDGDGIADQSTIFAGGFNRAVDGLLAGLLARHGEVWATNIPSLWKLTDKNNDGAADTREETSTGYGVRFAFFGHDMHGLRVGPDGRLYWTIGDRGATVHTREGKLISIPDRGGVFRSELDGSRLELYAEGLRNPQELAFDDHGNLFTGDNNSDGGDKARFVYLVEGGDSGWRVGYQAIAEPTPRGPWNTEKLWYPQWKGQAAYLLAPIENISNGPSGLTYHPGTGHLKDLHQHFFLADFRGQANSSGIHAFATAEKGAGFTLVSPSKLMWGVLATDVDFGPDGALYVADWISGWDGLGKGRIHRLTDLTPEAAPAGEKVSALIASDYSKRTPENLAGLLSHADVRVRMEAQFALANLGRDDLLAAAAQAGQPPFAQLHGVWGLGQLLRGAPGTKLRTGVTAAALQASLVARLQAKPTTPGDNETRAQAAKVLGESPAPGSVDALVTALADPSPRVKFFAAQSLARLKAKNIKEPVLSLLSKNADQDPYLRHAGTMALAAGLTEDELAALAGNPSSPARMGAALALRRLQSPKVAAFLADKDVLVAREAARAINDVPIEDANGALAALGELPTLPKDDVILSRIVEANFRAGTPASAKVLARIAADTKVATHTRQEAVAALSDFGAPQPRNRLTGAYRPLPQGKRDTQAAADALTAILNKLLVRGQVDVFRTTAKAAARLKLQAAAPYLAAAVERRWDTDAVRISALTALADLKAPELSTVLPVASKDPTPRVRLWALKERVVANPALAPALVAEALKKGSVGEKQAAIGILGWAQDPGAEATLASLLDQLIAGKLPVALSLDVQEATKKRNVPALLAKLDAYEKTRPDSDIGPYLEAVDGGDPEMGQRTFLYNPLVQCRRCHSVEGHGGEVGPELKTVGKRRSRQYLLEAVVFPSKHFAPGFESVLVTMKDGAIHGGTVKQDAGPTLKLASAEEGELTLVKKHIASREPGASGMPDGFGSILSKRELRDLVAFLASQK